MKQILVITLFLVWSFTIKASDTTITFKSIAYSDLFEVAKNENKAVMLYFHFDGCGACVEMEKFTFSDKRVSDYFNSNFINFDINTQKGVGIEINKKYNIRLHPTFIFLDNSGNELHRLVGVFSPEEFLVHSTNILKYNINLTNYKSMYKSGNREARFLYDYTYMLRDAFELDSTVVNEYLEVAGEVDYSNENSVKYIYEFCIHNFKVFIPFSHPAFGFMLNNKDIFYEHLDSIQVNTRIVWILNNAIYKAIEERDESKFYSIIEILKDYDNGKQYLFKEMDGRITGIISNKNIVLTAMLNYYLKNDDQINYLKTLDEFISKIWHDADQLNNYAWGVYQSENADHTESVRTAIKCSIRSIGINNNYANNDTYAWLLYKSGDTKKALKQATKAIEIAKKNNEDSRETQKLIDLIKNNN